MKKTFIKRLSLNKSTVANLDAASMRSVKGGETFHGDACIETETDPVHTDDTCVTCYATCVTCNTCYTDCAQATCNDLITG